MPRNLSPEEARQIGRIGALRQHALHDSKETSAPGRAASNRRFEREVDPNGELPEAERLRRAEYARQAFMAQIRLKSAKARARRKSR